MSWFSSRKSQKRPNERAVNQALRKLIGNRKPTSRPTRKRSARSGS
jgi:hypothetical protein